MNEFNLLVETRSGPMLCNPRDAFVGKSLLQMGEFRPGERRLFDMLLKPGMVVMECGANIGAHTVHLCKTVGETGRVHAFEPQRIAFQTLCANLALNHIPNCCTYQAALGSEPGEIAVKQLSPYHEANFGGLEMGGTEGVEGVPVLTLDMFAQLPAIHLLKIDVEGMELDVLKGAGQLIMRHRPMLYVENDRKAKAAELLAYVHELGYAIEFHQPPLFEPDNFNGLLTSPWEKNYVSTNMLCVASEKVEAAKLLVPA